MRTINIWPARGNATYQGPPAKEWVEQKQFFELAAIALDPEEYAVLWHTPNGEYRAKSTAAKLTLMGVKKGVPDIFWAYPVGKYHGLFIELKSRSKSARTSAEEKEMLRRLEARGYATAVCHGKDEAFDMLSRYRNNQLGQEEDTCGTKTGK